MITVDQINLDATMAEIKALFDAYEAALMQNDLAALDGFFWQSHLTVRFGTAENLYGIEAIRIFRQARNTSRLRRSLRNLRITTYGTDLAMTTTEFMREDLQLGRQSQTWVRFPEGWRVVSAHVSLSEYCAVSSRVKQAEV